MPPDPVLLCRAAGGVIRTADLEAQGVTRRACASAVSAGSLERVRRGVLALPRLPEAVRHALRHGGRLACHSLLAAKGMWVMPDGRLHVHLPPDGHLVAADGCTPVLHRSRAREAGGPAATSVFVALAELSRCGGAESLLVALDSARRLRLVESDELPVLRLAVPRALRSVVDASTDQADSGLESLVRWRLARRGIRAEPQARLGDHRRRDLLVGDRLVIETDGGTHDDPRQRSIDMKRDAWATAHGFVVLRFDYDQVMHHWHEVEAAILAAMARGLHLAS